MSTEPPQDSTPDAELDDILSQATALASNLKEEIGETESSAEAGAPDPLTEVKTSTSDTVECELHELERLVASTSEEVGADVADETASSESTTSETAEPDPSASEVSEKPTTYAVPDFMSEFTEPEAPQEAQDTAPSPKTETAKPAPDTDSPATSAAAVPTTQPGVVGTERVGVVGAPILQTEDTLPAEPASEPQAGIEPAVETSTTETPKATAGDAFRALGRRFAPMGFALCAKGVRLLEAIDRPLGRIGAAPRRLLGWLAIATLGTASIVYVISLW